MMSRHFVEAVIKIQGWQPYITAHWINLSSQRGGPIITFKGHKQHEFKCSHKVAGEILNLYKVLYLK